MKQKTQQERLIGNKKREAIDSIGGYVYQLIQSVYSWIALPSGQELFLEGVEDIDLLGNSQSQISQIRRTASKISLGSKKALEALDHFCLHNLNNPSRDLHFKYLTTSSVCFEKKKIHPEIKGIELWNLIRGYEKYDNQEEIESIVSHIKNTKNNLIYLKHFVSHNNAKCFFENIIKKFEWIVEAENTNDIYEKTISKIIEQNVDRHFGTRQAEELFRKLYYVVCQSIGSDTRYLTKGDYIRIANDYDTVTIPRSWIVGLVDSSSKDTDISDDLLLSISRASIDKSKYANSFPDNIIERDFSSELLDSVTANFGVTFFVADSGAGKSTASIQLLEKLTHSYGLAFAIPETEVERALSPEDLIVGYLRRSSGDIEKCSMNEILDHVFKMGTPTILIEDVNRCSNTVGILKKISSWHIELCKMTEDTRRINILCPIWPHNYELLRQELPKDISLNIFLGRKYSQDEAIAAISGRYVKSDRTISKLKASEIADALSCDPLLIGIFDINSNNYAQPIEDYYNKCISEVARSQNTLSKHDIEDSLNMLAGHMLSFRTMRPSRLDLKEIDSNDKILMHINSLSKDKKIIFWNNDSGHTNISFRHDRIRDFILSKYIEHDIRNGNITNEYFQDPYFADIIAQSILRIKNIQQEHLQSIIAANHLSLFCVFKYSNTVNNEIIKTIKANKEMFVLLKKTNISILQHIAFELANCDSYEIYDFLKDVLVENSRKTEVLIRCGDLNAAINFCIRNDPGLTYPYRDLLIQHIKERFGPDIINSVSKVLDTFPESLDAPQDYQSDVLVGILRLIGYTKYAEFSSVIYNAWSRLGYKNVDELKAFFWASTQCCYDNAEKVLKPICDEWELLSDKDGDNIQVSSRMGFVLYELQWGLAREHLTESALKYLLKRTTDPQLQNYLTTLLYSVDHPNVMAFLVETAEENRWSFSYLIADYWNSRHPTNGHKLSETSKSYLKNIWLNQKRVPAIRKKAFQLWSGSADKQDIPILQSIGCHDEIFEWSITTRMLIGDHSCVASFQQLIRNSKKKAYLWQFARHIWSEEFEKLFLEEVKTRGKYFLQNKKIDSNLDWLISEIIEKNFGEKAEKLLLDNWFHLKSNPRFVQLALSLDSPRLLSLVAEVVNEHHDPYELFKHATLRLFNGTRKTHKETFEIYLSNVLPYLDFLDPLAIDTLWRKCHDFSLHEYNTKYLNSRLSRDGTTLHYLEPFGFENFLSKELDRQHHFPVSSHDIQLLSYYLLPGDSFVHRLVSWAKKVGTCTALSIAGNYIVYLGKRENLRLLESKDFCPNEQAEIAINNISYTLRRQTLT